VQYSLAGDDGTSWTAATSSSPASNSQCTVAPDSTVKVTFKPAFVGTKSIYVDATNGAGYTTGYQPMGGWTVQ